MKLVIRYRVVVLFLLLPFSVLAQQTKIDGKVTDDSNIPLPGVNVSVKGTTMGTITDNDGYYSLILPENANVLVFSFIGMQTQEVEIGNRSTIDVEMKQDLVGLDEVVIVGYGTQKKVNVTGSVGVINSEEIESMPVQNALQALQGMGSGLNISYSNGGLLNAQPEINIRGIATIGEGSTGNA